MTHAPAPKGHANAKYLAAVFFFCFFFFWSTPRCVCVMCNCLSQAPSKSSFTLIAVMSLLRKEYYIFKMKFKRIFANFSAQLFAK